MASHVDLVGALFVLWGALMLLIGLSTLALAVGATSVMASTSRSGGGQLAAGLTIVAFVSLAIVAMAWGLVHIGVGIALKRRRHWTRLPALMLGSVNLLLLPYGTALGCYTIWVLLHEEGKKLFEAPVPGAAAP